METWVVILVCVVPPWIAFVFRLLAVARERRAMVWRASDLLATMGEFDKTEVYLSFPSVSGRTALIEEKKDEMARQGWTYLRLKEAPVRQSMRTWGGGLIMQFVR